MRVRRQPGAERGLRRRRRRGPVSRIRGVGDGGGEEERPFQAEAGHVRGAGTQGEVDESQRLRAAPMRRRGGALREDISVRCKVEM